MNHRWGGGAILQDANPMVSQIRSYSFFQKQLEANLISKTREPYGDKQIKVSNKMQFLRSRSKEEEAGQERAQLHAPAVANANLDPLEPIGLQQHKDWKKRTDGVWEWRLADCGSQQPRPRSQRLSVEAGAWRSQEADEPQAMSTTPLPALSPPCVHTAAVLCAACARYAATNRASGPPRLQFQMSAEFSWAGGARATLANIQLCQCWDALSVLQ